MTHTSPEQNKALVLEFVRKPVRDPDPGEMLVAKASDPVSIPDDLSADAGPLLHPGACAWF